MGMKFNSKFSAVAVLLIISMCLSISASEEQRDSEGLLENKCAPHCLKILLRNTENMNNKLEACDKKNMQMNVLQSQLALLKMKETIYENKIKEKEVQCKSQEQLYADVSSIRKKMEHMAAHSQKEDIRLKEMLDKIEDYKATIDKKNEQIKTLQNKLEINEYQLETCNGNFTPHPEAIMLMDIKEKLQVKVFETSCLTNGNTSDIREIQVPGIQPFHVPCDGTIAGPGWTVIQRRVDNTVNFDQNWTEYRNGFGDLNGNFFIGLEKIYRMTNSKPHELYIYLQNFQNEVRHAQYNKFSIAGEETSYQLNVLDEFSGDAGDALKLNRNMKFTTFDRDNDKRGFDNCAIERHGGWWYNQCSRTNLNGRYVDRELDLWEGIWWWNWQETHTLKSVQMLIRPKNDSIK